VTTKRLSKPIQAYVPDSVRDKIFAAAKAAGVSVSTYIEALLAKHVEQIPDVTVVDPAVMQQRIAELQQRVAALETAVEALRQRSFAAATPGAPTADRAHNPAATAAALATLATQLVALLASEGPMPPGTTSATADAAAKIPTT